MLDATAQATLLIAVVVFVEAAGRRVAAHLPMLFVIAGALLGWVPGFPRIEPDPELALVIFLPPLIYEGAASSTWHSFRFNLRPIVLHAVGLVTVTAFAVAAAVRAVLPNFTWAQAFLLGAIVAPTDETAALAILHRLRVPKRMAAVLVGEDLLSDTTALTLFREAFDAERAALPEANERGEIDDEVLRRIQRSVDLHQLEALLD